jgi:simple sugar transport system permease protein
VLSIALFFVVAYVMWRTPFGLRLRSAGEKPSAADSLGVPVNRVKYISLAISGGLAGMGGAVLVLGGAGRYQEGLTQGIGYLGLAALIVGNWRPLGIAMAAALFGYFQAIAVRPAGATSVHGLLVMAALAMGLVLIYVALTRRYFAIVWVAIIGALALWAYLAVDEVNNQFVYITPYVVTLVVVTFLSQHLRPPAAAGQVWRKGQAT